MVGTKFIAKANLKKGALRSQLQIPTNKLIPMSLIEKVSRSKVGKTITNPSLIGKKTIKVTKLLKKRSILARTLKSI